MNVQLDPRGERLVEQQIRAGKYYSAEEVVARALEMLAESEPTEEEVSRREAVKDMMDFASQHKFTLGENLSIKDLLHEGHKY